MESGDGRAVCHRRQGGLVLCVENGVADAVDVRVSALEPGGGLILELAATGRAGGRRRAPGGMAATVLGAGRDVWVRFLCVGAVAGARVR